MAATSVNIHTAFLPLYLSALHSASHLLRKGATHTTNAVHLSETETLALRLAPDMNPLSFQVSNLCAIAMNLVTIVAQPSASARARAPSTSTSASGAPTIASLQGQLTQTISVLEALTREDFEGRDAAMVHVAALGRRMEGLEYVQEFGMMNLYFHLGMVYALFRAEGAPIGKWDYLKGGR